MHKEIEAKARLHDPKNFIAQTAKLGIQFGPPVTQRDKVFSPKNLQNFTEFHPGVAFLRIRQQGDKATLTLKKSELNESESTEIESDIGDAQATENILTNLGYVLSCEVEKKRSTAHYNEIELCLDEVTNLGTFIEVERIMPLGSDVQAIQRELFQFLKQFGVKDADRVTQGYDTLVVLAEAQKE